MKLVDTDETIVIVTGSDIRAEEREMSVLFSDIVGFTQLSSKLSPRQVIDLLNAASE